MKKYKKDLKRKDKTFLKRLGAYGGPTNPLHWYNINEIKDGSRKLTPLLKKAMQKRVESKKGKDKEVKTVLEQFEEGMLDEVI